jgi:hypothetical protein
MDLMFYLVASHQVGMPKLSNLGSPGEGDVVASPAA